jgi:hypothetical protein
MTRIPARLVPTQLGQWHVGPVRAGPTAHRLTGGALATPGLFTVGLGLLTVAWPLAWAPAWTYLLGSLGALAALVAAGLRWRRGPVLAVTAGVVTCAVSTAGAAVLTVEGLFILCYLLAAGAPPGRPVPWLRRQAVLLVAGLIATGAVLAMDAVHLGASAWITVAGLAAAVAAYLVALPRRAQTPGPQTSRSRDASSRPGSV